MKSIEEFDLKNMDLAVRYLSGKLSFEEEAHFQERLAHDAELREDLKLAKEHLGYELENKYSPEMNSLLQDYSIEGKRIERKSLVGKDLITYGLGAALTAVLMVLTCILFYFILK